MRFFRLLPPVRLWMRIAAMMLVAVLAVESLNAAALVFIPPRLMRVYGGHWLVETMEKAALAIFQADAKRREALATGLSAENHLQIHWLRVQQHPDETAPAFKRPFPERVRQAIESDLKGTVSRVTFRSLIGPRGNQFHVDLLFQPPDLPSRLAKGPLKPEDEDIAIPAPFEFGIQGADGSWVIVEPEDMLSYRARVLPWFITLLGAAVAVSLVSTFAARQWLRPLDRLAGAAREFGRTRRAVPVNTAGLSEFKVIEQAMNEMQDRIKRFLDERTHMLAAMSHDLRTGLTGLRLDAEDVCDGEAKERLVAGMEEMERMISATLDFAGDELKSEPAQAIDLAALLISLCDTLADRNYPVSYSGPDHLSAQCQPIAIKRAFANLIDNAIKYGGWACVSLSHSGGKAAIFITDGGPGIPAEKAELAFQAFRRLENSRSRETGGVGLGLTIARDIIRSNAGEIALGQPPQEKGLEVKVTLPLPVANGS